MRPWPSIREIAPSHVIREFKGINRLEAFAIADEFATDMKNLTSDKYPAFTTRPGFSLVGALFSNKIMGLASWKNAELHAVVGGSWYRYNGTAWSSALASGLSSAVEWSFTNFKGSLSDINLIGANGTDSIRTFNGSSVTVLSGAPSGGNYITSYSNRLFCATGNELRASELNVPTNWTNEIDSDADPFTLKVNTPDGETINALKPGIGHVTIFKPNSMHELYGEDPSNVRIEPITSEVGAINNKCAVTINGIMFILHRTGIYRYGGGTRPSRDFSQPVQAYIDQMNVSARDKCCVGTDGEKLYVSIPVDSNTAPDTLLVYDSKFDVWTVWRNFSALQIVQSGTNWYVGQNDGSVIQMGGSSDNGTPIAWERVSKPFGSGSLGKLIRWFKVWILCDVPSGSTLNVHVSPSAAGDSDWVQIGSVSAQSGYQSARIILTPTQLANANWIRIKFSGTGPVTVHEFDRDQREFPLI